MTENAEKVQVAIRWRPLLKRENQALAEWQVHERSVVLNNEYGAKEWTFDKVFAEEACSKDVYEEIVKPIVDKAIRGYNGTVFAYGQTGSGKTFTMRGNDSNPGIIPLTVDHLLASFEAQQDREFMIGMIYIEIYNEKIKNLLSSEERKLFVKEETETGNFEIQGIEQSIVSTRAEIMKLLSEGDSRRAVACTNMNTHSSRSHAIFRLTVESRDKALGSKSPITKSQLNLVDLAGSEKVSQTGASGQTFKEGAAINTSLFMLGRVISELTTGADHISYRDSVLTRILQPALGGNAKTAIIATATRANIPETKSTMLFANGAKNIKNKVRQNEAMGKDALIHRQAEEIKNLKLQIESGNRVNPAEINELQERIATLQKLFINKKIEPEVRQNPIRRYTIATGEQRPLGITRQAPGMKKPIAKEAGEEWVESADDILSKLDEDRELKLIDTNQRRSNEKKRTRAEMLSTSESPNLKSPVIKRHKSMISTVKFLEEIEFDDLNKENFNELKSKVRKSVHSGNEELITELRATLQCKEETISELQAKLNVPSDEATELRQRIAALEIELTEKSKLSDDAQQKCEDLEKNLAQKSERLESKLVAIGDRKSTEELLNQLTSTHAELKEKSKTILQMEERHNAEKQRFQANIDELTTTITQMKSQFLVLESQLTKVEAEKSVIETSLVQKAETVDVGMNTEQSEESKAIDDLINANIMLEQERTELLKKLDKTSQSSTSSSYKEVDTVNQTMCPDADSCGTCDFLNAEQAVQQSEITRLTLELESTKKQLAESGVSDVENMMELLAKAQKSESVTKLQLQMAEEKAAEAETALEPSKVEIEKLREKVAKLEGELKTSNERDTKTIEDLQTELHMAVSSGRAKVEHSIHLPTLETSEAEVQASVDIIDFSVQTGDSLEDIESKIALLEEQASAAEEFKASYVSKLAEKEEAANELLSNIEDLRQKLTAKDTEFTTLQEQLVNMRQMEVDIAEKNDRIDDQAAQIAEKEDQLVKMQDQLSEIDRLRLEVAEKSEKIDALVHQASETESQLATLRTEREKMSIVNENLSEMDSLKEELSSKNDRIEKLLLENDQQTHDLALQVTEKTSQLTESEEHVRQLQCQMEALRTDVANKEEENLKLQSENESKFEEASNGDDRVSELKSQLDRLRNELATNVEESEKLRTEAEAKVEKLMLQLAERDMELEKHTVVSEVTAQNESELETIKETLVARQEEIDQLRSDLNMRMEEVQHVKSEHSTDVEKLGADLCAKQKELDQMRSLTDERTTQLAHSIASLEKENQTLHAEIKSLLKPVVKVESPEPTDKLSKSEMEELGIEDDSETVDESQPLTQLDIVESVEICPRVPMTDSTTQTDDIQKTDACLNTSVREVADQNTSSLNFSLNASVRSEGEKNAVQTTTDGAVDTSVTTPCKETHDAQTSMLQKSMMESSMNTSIIDQVEKCDMQTSYLQESEDVGINTSFTAKLTDNAANTSVELVHKNEYDLLLADLSEKASLLERAYSNIEALEAQLVKNKETANVSLNTSTVENIDLDVLRNLEEQLADEKQRFVKVAANAETLEDSNRHLANELDSLKSREAAVKQELEQLQERFSACQKSFEDELARTRADADNEKSNMAPIIEELSATRQQRSEYVDKYKAACDEIQDKDSKLHAAAEMFQNHRNQITKLEAERDVVKSELEILKQKVHEVDQNQAVKDDQTSQLESKLAEQQTKLSQLQSENENLQRRCDGLAKIEKDVEELMQQIDVQNEKVAQFDQVSAGLKKQTEKSTNLENKLSSVTKDCQQLAGTLQEMQSMNEELQSKVKNLNSDIVAKEDLIMEKKNKISQLQADILAIQTKQHHSSGDKDEIKSLRATIEEQERVKQSIIQKHDKNDEILRDLKSEYSKAMKVIEELEREDTDWKLKTNQLTIDKNKAVDEVKSLKAQGAIFKKEYTSMETKLSAATKELSEKEDTLASLQAKVDKSEQEILRVTTEKQQTADKLEEKEQKYKKLSETYVRMKADFKTTKVAHTELLRKSTLPCGNTVADIKDKLKKYYYLYDNAIKKPCAKCGTVPKPESDGPSSSRARSTSAVSVSSPRTTRTTRSSASTLASSLASSSRVESSSISSKKPDKEDQAPKADVEEKPDCQQQ